MRMLQFFSSSVARVLFGWGRHTVRVREAWLGGGGGYASTCQHLLVFVYFQAQARGSWHEALNEFDGLGFRMLVRNKAPRSNDRCLFMPKGTFRVAACHFF